MAFFKKLAAGCSIYEIYVGLHVISLLVCLAILFLVLAAKPSRGQSATVLLVSSGCIYTFGFLVEITSGNVGGFYAATLLEYFEECLLMVAFTMFVAEMCHREIPLFIYALEVLCGILILWLLFTTRENGIFYTYIALAGENALQHGQEGIMVVNNHGVITYVFNPHLFQAVCRRYAVFGRLLCGSGFILFCRN